MARFRSNNDNFDTYVTAENTSTYSDDHQTIICPLFSFVFYVILKQAYCCTQLNTKSNTCYSTRQEYKRPISYLESAVSQESLSVVAGMLADTPIPFLLENPMFWINLNGSNFVPLWSHEDMVRKISQFAGSIIRDQSSIEASKRTYNKLHMTIMIEKTMIMPLISKHDSFLCLQEYFRLSRLNSHKFSLMRLKILAGESIEALLGLPNEVAVALEKFIYDGSSDDHDDDQSKLTCAVCFEDVMIGSHLTRMPCSHVFHGDCILGWLEISKTCPICRFKLSIIDDC